MSNIKETEIDMMVDFLHTQHSAMSLMCTRQHSAMSLMCTRYIIFLVDFHFCFFSEHKADCISILS